MVKNLNLTNRLSRAGVAAGLALGVTLASAPLAAAHDAVVGGSPAENEVVQEIPETLTIDFSGEVQDGFNTLALSRGDNEEVIFSGEPVVEGKEVSLTLPDDLELAPGTYRIGYQIVSSDGHPTKGATSFTYEPANASTAASSEATGDTNSGVSGATSDQVDAVEDNAGFNMAWVWAILGILVIGGVAAAALARTKKTQQLDADQNNPSATDK